MSDVTVLFIVGWDRSGSTILDLLLGGIEGFFAVGELRHLWGRGVLQGRLCGCGSPVTECDVWGPVLRAVHNGRPALADVRSVVRTKSEAMRVRSTWQILRTRGGGLESYLSLMTDLYEQIADRTGAAVVVDASKDASDAAVLTLLPGVRPYFVHLVRDPRATAFSMSRRPKPQPDTRDAEPMSRQAALQSTANWVLWNLAAERVRAEVAKDAWLRLRYEDFVADPIGAVQRITRLVGRGGVATPFVDGRTAVLDGNHTVSGNPSRFSSGSVTIADDAQWLREQGAVERITSTAVALPLLRRYGYPLVPSDHRSM